MKPGYYWAKQKDRQDDPRHDWFPVELFQTDIYCIGTDLDQTLEQFLKDHIIGPEIVPPKGE